ncbi:hypothetical protein ACTHPH_10415 [Paenibacillus pasadenensis]|uniref:Glycosyl transferase family 28 C-terminal domain-containing protein n=1 Tax=Paenibacillus pasadenensis TaxID=217090 RepID=A0A2N5NAH5_9BACL|nr:hypothetical protein [Paenibacillus pasadenensis]PLT47318.1 hypothetical protein B8V81_1542 [Paenibacillus pasadenensis]
MALSIAYYVSDYGYGHASRSIAVIRELLRQADEAGLPLQLHLASGRTLPLLERSLAGGFAAAARSGGLDHRLLARRIDSDPGYSLRPGSLQADPPRLRAEVLAYLEGLPLRIRREAAWLGSTGASLTVSDIVAEAFPAARRAGIRSVGLSNFTWYTAYQELLPEELLAPLARPYLDMDAFVALAGASEPQWGSEPIERTGYFCRAADPERAAELRRRLDPSGERRLLALFPGMGSGPGSPLERLGLLRDPRWLAVVSSGMELPDGAEAVRIPESCTESQLYVAACDAVLTKPGWGTVSEAVCLGKPLALLERPGFREDRCIAETLRGRHPLLMLGEPELASPELGGRLLKLLAGGPGSAAAAAGSLLEEAPLAPPGEAARIAARLLERAAAGGQAPGLSM